MGVCNGGDREESLGRRPVPGGTHPKSPRVSRFAIGRQDNRRKLNVFFGQSRIAVCALNLILCILGVRFADAAPALQMFADPKQVISPVAITEDTDGFLWVAADQGVFQFDGNHFLKIPGDFVRPAGIAVIGTRTVLIAGNNGVFEYSNGVTTILTADATIALIKLNDDMVLALHFRIGDGASMHWMSAAVWKGGGVRLRPVAGIDGWAWLSSDGWLSFACGPNPCSLQNSGDFRAELMADHLKEYIRTNAKAATRIKLPPEFDSVLRDSSDTYFFRPTFSGTLSVRPPNGKGRDYNVGDFTRANGRAGLHPGRAGRLWIPGDYLYVSEGNTVKRFDAPQLDAIRVNCVFEDGLGRTWFGLAENGLAVMGSGPVVDAWYTPPSLGEINSLVRQGPSAMYATTSKGTLLVHRSANGNPLGASASGDWVPIHDGEEGPRVVQLAPGDHGTMIGLTGVGPPVRLNANGRVLDQISTEPSMMLSSLRRLVRAPDGAYLVGSQQSPDCLYRIKGSHVERISVEGPNGNVHDIGIDADGYAWVGYANGICRIESTGCQTAITKTDGLLEPMILSLGIGPPDEIWTAYRSGFSRFRFTDGRWVPRHFLEEDGYQAPQTHFLRRDRRGWVWRGTGRGLFVSDGVHVEPGDWLLISDRDGLPSANVNLYGFFEDTDGSIWIGTTRGIAHLLPDPSWFQTKGAKVTSITYQGKQGLGDRAFSMVFDGPGELTATIGPTGLIPARYRLLPADNKWQISYTGEIRPQRLEPGQYELEVASGQGGSSSRYRFQVVPTFAAKLRESLLVGSPILVLAALGVFLWRRRIRDARLPPLPDLAEARLVILSPSIGGVIGTNLSGRFLPQNLLARGGFGTVFDGRDLKTGLRCAIKVFRPEFGDERITAQFEQEVAALEAIQHPNVVKLIGNGTTTEGEPFLAMEFIEGSTLRELLSDGPISPGNCARFLRQIASALHALHSQNIFHRDLKPENLMIRRSAPANADVVLIDFSMAIIKDPDRSLFGLSRAGGTIHYMAPEQALGHASAEGDIYSLGKVVIEMLTGRRITDLLPQATLDLSERTHAFLQAQPFGLSAASIRLLASSLEFDPTRRVHSVGEFAEPIVRDLEFFATVEKKDSPAVIALPLPRDDAPAEG